MHDDSLKKTILVALCVCIVSSLLVTTAEVSLRGYREENKRLYRIDNILLAAGLSGKKNDAVRIYEERVRPVLVDLRSGKPVPRSDFNDVLNIDSFDIRRLADDPEYGRSIPEGADRAGLARVPAYMPIYFILEGGEVHRVVFPIYGHGIWSTMYGFIALERDLKTVRGFTIYEHGETPGLGGEVDNPRWKSTWKGKQAYDEEGNLRIGVEKRDVDPTSPDAVYHIEGLSGATLTTHGVNGMVKFWLGDNGYGPLIERLRKDIYGYL
ncbi:MAG: Na(+)-translocating NADH-quinone reductase subunit C [Nitrospiraceae bacterium]|nr:MAG: Na(+)-translocating NADH-quinone reductase subunit C [Nitrospiraceae bacterium]